MSHIDPIMAATDLGGRNVQPLGDARRLGPAADVHQVVWVALLSQKISTTAARSWRQSQHHPPHCLQFIRLLIAAVDEDAAHANSVHGRGRDVRGVAAIDAIGLNLDEFRLPARDRSQFQFHTHSNRSAEG